MRSETCFLIIVPPQLLPPQGGKKDTERREMGRPRAAKSKKEGRGAHSHVSGIWRKHTVQLFPNNRGWVGQVTCWLLSRVECQGREFRICWGHGWYIGAAVGVRVLHPGSVDWRCGSARGFSGCPGSTPGQSTHRDASAKTSVQQRQGWTRGQRAGSRGIFVTDSDTSTCLTGTGHTVEKVSPQPGPH